MSAIASSLHMVMFLNENIDEGDEYVRAPRRRAFAFAGASNAINDPPVVVRIPALEFSKVRPPVKRGHSGAASNTGCHVEYARRHVANRGARLSHRETLGNRRNT